MQAKVDELKKIENDTEKVIADHSTLALKCRVIKRRVEKMRVELDKKAKELHERDEIVGKLTNEVNELSQKLYEQKQLRQSYQFALKEAREELEKAKKKREQDDRDTVPMSYAVELDEKITAAKAELQAHEKAHAENQKVVVSQLREIRKLEADIEEKNRELKNQEEELQELKRSSTPPPVWETIVENDPWILEVLPASMQRDGQIIADFREVVAAITDSHMSIYREAVDRSRGDGDDASEG